MTIEKLGTANYGIWKRRIRSLLESRGEWGYVTGDEDDKAKSAQVKGTIPHYVDDYHLQMADGVVTAKGLWDKLEKTFQASTNAKRLLLRQQLSSLRKEPKEEITKYIARAKGIASDLDSIGHPTEPSELVLPIMAGLPKEYSVLVSIVGASKTEYTLEEILQILLIHEQQIIAEGRHETVPVYGMRDLSFKGKSRRQPRQNKPPVQQLGQQSGSRGAPSKRIVGNCFYCDKPGHMQRDCRSRIEDEKRGVQRTIAFSASTMAADNNDWIIDSGATKHLTPNRQILQNYRSVESNTEVLFVNGQQSNAEGQGDVELQVKTPFGIKLATLHNVLHVPEATASLFSTRQAMNHGSEVKFSNNRCQVTLNGKVVMEGISQGDGLMVINQVRQHSAVALAVRAAGNETPELWHRRFGHRGYDNLAKLKDQNMVEGISVSAADFKLKRQGKPFCEPCTLAKQHRLPFPTSDSKSSSQLELVHMDVCGPLQEESTGGARYLATFIDDYSKLAHVEPLAQKSDVAEAVKKTMMRWETQSGKRLKAVRTDRGTEYLNTELETYFSSRGIVHQTTAAYTPEQNGVAERFNRTLMEKVRAMLYDAKLDYELWAEAAATATYVRNRSPTSQNAQTPWELFYGSKPDVSGMRVFGAQIYKHVPKQLRRKLDPLSEKGLFMGYQPDSKAYRVLIDGRVSIARDLTFVESQQGATAGEAATEANEANPATHTKEDTIELVEEEEGINRGPSYSTDSEAAEEAAEEAARGAEPITQGVSPEPMTDGTSPEPTSAGASPTAAEDSAQQSDSDHTRYPQRDRQPPAVIYKPRAHAAKATELTMEEPHTYAEALKSPEAAEWTLAMGEEMASLQENCTWTLEEQPRGVRPIPVKWVYKIKRDAGANIERYKARLVAKGFMQQEGINYNEVFAPVSKHTTLRTLLALAAAEDMELHQLDIETAFLNGDLEETIYMQQPEGYAEGGPNMVCHLRKALYGLKQAPRAWNTRLKQELESMGFTASEADPGLFIGHFKHGTVYLLVYVDDILVAAKSIADIRHVKDRLTKVFKVRDLGEAKYFLGMSLDRDRQAKTLKMTQERLAIELVSRYGMRESKTKSVPLSTSIKLEQATEDNLLDREAFPYNELVGSLLYLSVCTRPDISQAVGVLARYMAKPSTEHWTAAKGVLRYIAGTLKHGICFGGSSTSVEGYCDADYASDLQTRRSTTGFVFILGGGAISWGSRLQPTVAASTSEAEHMAAAQAVKEALWLRTLLSSFGSKVGAMKIYCDSQGAIKLLKHPIASIRSKHIDVIHHFARERVYRKEITFEYISTEDMVADCLTKALPMGKFKFCTSSMGVV